MGCPALEIDFFPFRVIEGGRSNGQNEDFFFNRNGVAENLEYYPETDKKIPPKIVDISNNNRPLKGEYGDTYHTHYRDFDPRHNRWDRPDPAGMMDGMNLYAGYFGVNGVDPDGRFTFLAPLAPLLAPAAKLFGIGTAIGFGIEGTAQLAEGDFDGEALIKQGFVSGGLSVATLGMSNFSKSIVQGSSRLSKLSPLWQRGIQNGITAFSGGTAAVTGSALSNEYFGTNIDYDTAFLGGAVTAFSFGKLNPQSLKGFLFKGGLASMIGESSEIGYELGLDGLGLRDLSLQQKQVDALVARVLISGGLGIAASGVGQGLEKGAQKFLAPTLSRLLNASKETSYGTLRDSYRGIYKSGASTDDGLEVLYKGIRGYSDNKAKILLQHQLRTMSYGYGISFGLGASGKFTNNLIMKSLYP